MSNLTPLLPVLDINQTQTQFKIANVSNKTHIRHIDQGILPVRYDKATAGSENIKRCQILTPLIPVLDVNQTQTQLKIANVSDQTHIRHINQGILPVQYDKATAGSENMKQCQILTPLIPVSDVNQTQTQLKIAKVSNQTHIRHINQGILPVQNNKAKAGSENIERCLILTTLIPVSDVNQTQTQLKIANISDQTHIRNIDRGILPLRYDKTTAGSENIERCQILTPLIPVLDVDQIQTQPKLQMFLIKLILGISTKGYYQFDMTKPQLDLRTSNNVKF